MGYVGGCKFYWKAFTNALSWLSGTSQLLISVKNVAAVDALWCVYAYRLHSSQSSNYNYGYTDGYDNGYEDGYSKHDCDCCDYHHDDYDSYDNADYECDKY